LTAAGAKAISIEEDAEPRPVGDKGGVRNDEQAPLSSCEHSVPVLSPAPLSAPLDQLTIDPHHR
jgi:hypothetical protein